MTDNLIDLQCTRCENDKADVLCKVGIMIKKESVLRVQTKCTKCNYNQFLKDDDKRCKQFFKDSSEN